VSHASNINRHTDVSKDIFIMSTNCDACGYRDNEVKSGSAISDKGKRIILKVEDREDLSRDILKVHRTIFSIRVYQLLRRAKHVGFQSQKSTWFYRPVHWVEDLRPWRESWIRYTRNCPKRCLLAILRIWTTGRNSESSFPI
jgi:hypothetical protein